MKYGIIDIGSNTIRTVVYEVTGKNYKQLINEKDFSGIISYVKNQELAEGGLSKICGVLSDMGTLCRVAECAQTHCFATASLRDVHNIESILQTIKTESGVDVQLISSEQEAHYDFIGLRHAVNDPAGIGVDLGGGSCQIFKYQNDALTASCSIKTGCLKMFNTFVKGIIPTKSEKKNIKNFVKQELQKYPNLKNAGFATIYATGGSARAAARLHRALIGSELPVYGYKLTVEQLSDLSDLVEEMGTNGIRLISQVIPERINTILPALVVLKAVCKYTGAAQLEVIKNGVREGYLWENILSQQATLPKQKAPSAQPQSSL